jgi:hypothetical protein
MRYFSASCHIFVAVVDFLSRGGTKKSRHHGRDQEEDAGDEDGEGQRHG